MGVSFGGVGPAVGSSVAESPEGPVQAGGTEIAGGDLGVLAVVGAVKASAVPAGRQAPQSGEIQDVTACLAGAGEPGLHAALGTEQALVRAGIDHVVPCLVHGDKEVSDFGTLRWAGARDRPCQRATAGRAGGGDQDAWLIGHQVGDGEAVPGAPAPPQGLLAHYGEPEVHGREGMGHDDVARLVQHELTLSRKLGGCLIDLRFVYRGLVLDLLAARWVPLARERVVDGPADVLDNLVGHGPATPRIACAGRGGSGSGHWGLSYHTSLCRGRRGSV